MKFATTAVLFAMVCVGARAQTAPGAGDSPLDGSRQALPDAPGETARGRIHLPPLVPSLPLHTEKYIGPGEITSNLTAKEKVVLGIRDAFTPFAAVGWLASAGVEQVTNGSPNYGSDKGALGQRLGAAALRNLSEGIFSDSVLAPALHQDPRYYIMGSSHPLLTRLIYAGTRPIITLTDGGRHTVNLSALGGNLAGSALTQVYYPVANRGVGQVMQTFGGSLAGGAIGDVIGEFYGDLSGLFRGRR